MLEMKKNNTRANVPASIRVIGYKYVYSVANMNEVLWISHRAHFFFMSVHSHLCSFFSNIHTYIHAHKKPGSFSHTHKKRRGSAIKQKSYEYVFQLNV